VWTNFVLLKKLKKRVYEHFIGCRWPNSTLSYSLFFLKSRRNLPFPFNFRDRPFNLKRGGVMVFCFVQKLFFGQHKSWNINFFCRAKREFFPQNLTLGYMTKTLESDYYFFSSTKIRIFFSATLGIRIFFLEKNHTPPLKLNGPSLNMRH
jgi:hypothetical protein